VRLLNRATGKVVKSFPKKGTPNDGEAYAAWKKQLAVVVKSRVKQLKKLFESGGASGYEKWRAQNCSNAIYAALARGLVWGIYDGKEVVGTFRLDEELREVDCGGNVVSIAENAQIGVMHPVDLTEEAMSEWREAFAATAQPLPQLETPVCLPAPDTLQARYMGCMVHPGTLLHGGNGYDEEGGVTAGNETVTVTIINLHDFSGITLYPIIDVSVNEKQFADKRRYNTDVLWMDKLLDPFQKAREAVRTGSLEDVRKMVDIQLIISDNIREMIDLAGQSDRTETAAYLLNLSNEWGVGADDDLSL